MRVKQFFARPELVLSVIMTSLLGLLVLVPLAELIRETMTVQYYDTAYLKDAEVGDFTWFHFDRVFNSDLSWAIFYKPFMNSMITAGAVTIFCILLGGGLAWVVVRTDIPMRKSMNTLVVIPYMMPSWVLALAWITFFKNDRVAGSEGVFAFVFGSQPPDWVAYGMFPIIVCLALHYYVYAYLMISGALTTVDSQLEEAGAVAGLSKFRQFLMITAPLLLPAIASGIVMTFIRVVGSFGTPALLGMPVRFFVLPTQIYNALGSRNAGDGYLLALVLVVLAITFIYMNSRLIGARKSFVTLTGKGFRQTTVSLGAYRWPVFIFIMVLLSAAVVIPIALLLMDSLMMEAGQYSWSNITSHYWTGYDSEISPEPGVLLNENIGNAAWNSLRLALMTALFTGIFGLLIGYVVVRTRGSFMSKALENVSFTPYIFPAVALGAIYLGMFSKAIGPIPALYGTFTLLMLISAVKSLPFTSRTGISALLQIDKSLEETARVQGINWYKRMYRIIIPIASSGLIAGMLLSYITVMRELSLIILLITPSTSVLTTLIFDFQLQDLSQHVGAATLLLVSMVVIVNIIIRLLSRKSNFNSF